MGIVIEGVRRPNRPPPRSDKSSDQFGMTFCEIAALSSGLVTSRSIHGLGRVVVPVPRPSEKPHPHRAVCFRGLNRNGHRHPFLVAHLDRHGSTSAARRGA